MIAALLVLFELLTQFNIVLGLNSSIINGHNVHIKDFPYQGSLQILDGVHICGVALISPFYALTAAHCTEDETPKSLSIRFGSADFETAGEVIPIAKIVDHPKYNGNSADFDISILKFVKKLKFTSKIQAVQLVGPDLEPIKAHSAVIISGWGLVNENGHPPKVLQAQDLLIVPHSECKKRYSALTRITERMICAEGPQTKGNICDGDSGGPLILAKTKHLIGLASFSRHCGALLPAVFTNIKELRSWIQHETGI